MITLEIIQRIWSLFPPPAPDGTIEVRELDIAASHYGNPLLTIDGIGQRHLLIPAPRSTKPMHDKRSSGVQLLVTTWGEGENRSPYVDLICLKPHLNGLFDLIIYDVVSELLKSRETPDRVCLLVLNRWRELLARDTIPLPDRSTIVGLFGELIVLRDLARINPLALNNWTGPDKGRFDFFGHGNALEVKTSFQRQGIVLSIHGHDQLDPPLSGTLYLVVLQIEETPGGGESLSDVVNSLVSIGINQVDIYGKLARLGFFPETLTLIDDQRYGFVEKRIYLVNSEFPRITGSSFIDGTLPRGVISLSYQIDLSVPPPYPIPKENTAEVYSSIVEGLS
ncbi:PD-(D/E)XK motif protein [Betaproteobacteria bacterium PRO4]|nr:PD-(D/E)XK motif protein [Betaproteobacteria bacterium PRO4]